MADAHRGMRVSPRSLMNAAQFWWDRHTAKNLAIVWLASYPRSGNTFFRAILKEIYDLPTYDLYRLRKPTAGVDVGEDIGLTTGSLPRVGQGSLTYVVKTHDMAEEDYPGIYLVRDGRDAVVSYAHFSLKYFPRKSKGESESAVFESTLRHVITRHRYGGWSRNVESWLARSTPTAIVRFEDLIQTPVESVNAALDAIHYPLPAPKAERPPTFEELQQQKPDFFRKGRVGGWREEMPDDLHRLFWQHHGETMVKMGYTDDMP